MSDQHNGHAYRPRRNGVHATWPNTTLAYALLIALTKWAVIHHDDDAKVMLPTGRVTGAELIQVLRALESARQLSSPNRPRRPSHMKNKFHRQTNGVVPVDLHLDFGAAETKIPVVFEPGDYKLNIEAARIIQHEANVLIMLDLIEAENNRRVSIQPLWVAGPNADSGHLAAENQALIAALLSAANLPTAGNVSELVPKLAGLTFHARLVLAPNSGTGRTYNAINDIYGEDDAS